VIRRMNSRLKAGVAGGVALAFFLVIGWVVGSLLGLDESALRLFRGIMTGLGFAAGALVTRLLWNSGRSPRTEAPDDIALSLGAAQDRLARSSAPRSRLDRLPVTLLMGPRGSTKTTLMARTGLEPELLAGEILQGDEVVPTEGINVWYQDGTVILEAGGEVLEDEGRWTGLARRLRPASLGAAAGKGRQPARSVVLCFGTDEFLKPGARESVPEQARILRNRLAQLSAEVGAPVPVYVLFTRTDRLPFFLDYVGTLKAEEVLDPLGTTLPIRAAVDAGAHGREEGARIRAAFDELHASLGVNRLRVLPREGRDEIRSGAYELPRELRKISEAATAFLVELSRPSQLGVTPVLRGFYFTGVRPVLVKDSEASAPVPTAPRASDVGATGVFSVEQFQGGGQAQPAPGGGGSRKVPEWVFIQRFFREILPGDAAAQALTAGGARVQGLRRVALGLGVAAATIALVGFTTSFFANRALESRIAHAGTGVAALSPDPGIPPTLGELERLDSLRVELEALRSWERSRPPLRLRWGLYQGDRLLPPARALYFQRFDDLLWSATRARLVAYLDGLEGEPGEEDDYGETYSALRSYLVTTRHPDRSESGVLSPVLIHHWAFADELDEERRALVRAQFDFFARELREGHPLPREADLGRVTASREFLFRFAETDRVYQALLSDGSTGIEPVELSQITSSAGGALGGSHSVPGAFTEGGWERVQAALADVDRLFAAEAWVVGEQAISDADRDRLGRELRERYVAEYVDEWQQFLRAATVPGFGSVADAARRLDVLAGNQSPVLQVLATVARNTAVDSARIMPAFQPVHEATPPEIRDRFVSDPNQDWVGSLGDLQGNMDQLANATGAQRDQAMGAASANADQARRSVRQLAQGFSVEGEARVAATEVQRLLETPIQLSEALMTRLPAAQVNARGQAFCSAFTPVLAQFPFDRTASTEVGMDDMETLFAPETGVLWSFYEELGRSLMARQGNRFVAAPDASPRPTAEFLAFFNQAAEISRAFFGDRGSSPEVVFALRPDTSDDLPEIVVSIDGQTQRFTRTMAAAQTFVWQGSRADNARVSGLLDGSEVTLLEAPSGPWALFRLFGQANWESAGDGRYRLQWPVQGRQINITAELSLPRGLPVFRTDFMRDLRCASRIAQ